MDSTFGIASRDMVYLRRVYFWLLVGVLTTAASAWMSLNLGDMESTVLDAKEGAISVPPMVAAMAAHPYASPLLFLGLVFVTLVCRNIPAVSSASYLLFTAFAGVFVGPLLFLAEWKAAHHATLSAHPIRDSFLMTLTVFVGLSTYVWVSKRDFSWLGGFLYIGLWVTIIASIMCIFVGSHALEMAVDSVVVLLFSGYILYDTQRVLQKSDGDDPMGDAMNLYLDVLNIFIRLVSITSSSKDD